MAKRVLEVNGRRSPGTPNAFAIRGSKQWQEWIQQYAWTRHRTTITGLIDKALIEMARSEGYPLPPCRTER